MIRLVWRTDVHLSDRTPSMRTDDWTKTVLGKLDQVGRVAAKVGAVGVLDGGDFFHIKSPSRNSHRLIQEVASLHATYPCPVYANVGNHDCVYGDIEYLDQQPLGVLFAAGVFERCYDEHEAHFMEPPTSVADDGIVVRVVGIPYHGTKYDMARFDIKKGDEDYLIVMGHVLASHKGGSMFEGEDIVKYADLAGLDPDLWLFGHWHKDQGITDLGNGKQVVNIGSLTRGTLSQDDVERKPACVVLSCTESGIKANVVRLRVGEVDDVFDTDAKFRTEARDSTMDHFIEVMRESLVLDGGKTVEETVEGADVPDKVRERALLYLEQADV
ncbi:metallophosphoesterase [Deltaproteobacteria bacterium]|nr:metallophosphoesterase [Deltaproteobacteria bacterium]